jgi:hypothetical protein
MTNRFENPPAFRPHESNLHFSYEILLLPLNGALWDAPGISDFYCRFQSESGSCSSRTRGVR